MAEMKGLYFGPVNVTSSGQRFEKRKLRHARCEDNSRVTLLRDGLPNRVGCLPGRSLGQRTAAFEDLHQHADPHELDSRTKIMSGRRLRPLYAVRQS